MNIRSRVTAIDAYVGAIVVAGAFVLGSAAAALPSTPHVRDWGALAALALIASRFPLRVPGRSAWFSISDTFFMTSALLFGPAPATLTIAVDSMLMSLAFKTFSMRRFLFNSSAPAVAFWVGAEVFFRLSGFTPLYGTGAAADTLVFPVACFAAVYFVLNSGLTAIAIGLEKQRPPLLVWRSHFLVVSLNYFASGSIAFLLILFTQYQSVIALLATIPLIAVIHLAMQSWAGRLEDAEQHVATVDRLYVATIGALSTAIEAKDGVTSSHIHRVQHYAMGLAHAVGHLDEQTLKAIQAAALLHDTGKLAVPERILNKPGKLTPPEFEMMKLHVDAGADILSSIEFPYPVVPIVRAHHENWDGSGYPNGLKGEEIPIGARILSIVDCYDALTSDRPYRPAMSDDEALAIVRARRGTFYDPALVDIFERVCGLTTNGLKAIQQINRAAAAIDATPARTAAPAALAPPAEGPDSLCTLANLARIVSGRPTATDVASMIWAHLRHLLPDASCAFFLPDAGRDTVSARFVAGDASVVLQGLEFALGDKLTGWVAEHQQPIINSGARLDLGDEAAFVGLRHCVALPLASEGTLAGVLSLYGAEPFTGEQVERLQSVLPHLAVMFLAVQSRSELSRDSGVRPGLRVVASR
jgi:putative nucleotidyltransferase with HDIG domain